MTDSPVMLLMETLLLETLLPSVGPICASTSQYQHTYWPVCGGKQDGEEAILLGLFSVQVLIE